MEGHRRDGTVVVGGDARQRFHDARGYGRALGGDEVALAPVEAAHLLYRGDLDAVDGMGFGEFLTATGTALPFVVYRDLRDRGFYLAPAREERVDDPGGIDFVVYERGDGPPDGDVAHRVRVLGERRPVPAADLGSAVLAVVDEDGELTYFDTFRPDLGEAAPYDPPGAEGVLLDDRVLVWNPPGTLYERGFFGQRLGGRGAGEGPIQLSLVEAAYLYDRGALSLSVSRSALGERGRAVEGKRFDRRLRAYAALRDRGIVPKSGFKFGADFRAYEGFESVDSIDHSDRLVRVVPPDHAFAPRDVSLDVRLANGVRKQMVYALVGEDLGWVAVERLTP